MKVSNRITRLVTAGLIAGALAAPTASAVPAGPDAPNSGEPVVLESAPAPVVTGVDEGFDWTSAAIGAGAAGGLLLLFGVGGATYRHRQGHADVAH
jgi:hypothetical protein